MRSIAESLHRIRKQCRTRSATADETLKMIALLDHAIRQCTIAHRALVEMAEQRRMKPLRIAK